MHIATIEVAERGAPPTFSVYIKAPQAHLFDSLKTEREEKTGGERQKKSNKKKEGPHTHLHTSFLSFSVGKNKERGGWGERKREDRERSRKEGGM